MTCNRYHSGYETSAGWITAGILSLMMAASVPACSDDDDGTGGTGGTAGTGGAAGTGGTAGTGGAAGEGGAGGGDGSAFDLTFSGTGFQGPHDGQTMYFALWNDANQSAAENTWQVTVDADPLDVSRPGVLAEGESYTLYYFADVNGNGTCDGPAAAMDHAWSQPIASVSADVEVTDTHSLDFDGDCSRH